MCGLVGRCARRRWALVCVSLGVLGLLWVGLPALALASHDTGVEMCDRYDNTKDRCDCMYHVDVLIRQQLTQASPDPGSPQAVGDFIRTGSTGSGYTGYEDRGDIKDDDDERPVAWWRVESWQEACARLDLVSAAKGITRFLAGAVTGLVGISFVWSVVQMMQESVSGGRVVEARNNLFRTLVGLMFFGFSWVIYEAVTVGLFGVPQFTAGSFVGLTGYFGY